jgi:tRNA A-37 threonylcarbamoyl transferase component Bud32
MFQEDKLSLEGIDSEDQAWQIIEDSKIPDELKEKWGWEDRLIKDENPDIILAEMQKVLKHRFGSLEGKVQVTAIKENQEIPGTDLLVIMKEIQQQKENLIGTGGTAEVFKSKNYPTRYCYKIINNFDEYQYHHDIDREAHIASEIYNLEQDYVKIPEPLYVVKSGNTHVLIMEIINGKDLEQALIDDVLPENFNYEDFFKKLKDFFYLAHQNGIFHRDIKLSNIMVEWKTGKPCLIDFGKTATNVLTSEDPYLQFDHLKKISKKYPNDDDELAAISRNKILINLANKKYEKPN